MSARPRAEDLENQAGAVDDLAVPRLLEVALLDRRDRRVDDDDADLFRRDDLAERGDRATAEQRRRTSWPQWHDLGAGDLEVDRACEADGFVKARRRRAAKRLLLLGQLDRGMNDEGTEASRALVPAARVMGRRSRQIRRLRPLLEARRAVPAAPASRSRSRACRQVANARHAAAARRNCRTK